jgi:16S rRNA processing protein RimM
LLLVLPDGERHRVEVMARPGAGRRVLGQIAGVASREEAEALVGSELVLPRAELPAAEDGSWYHHDLIGLPVRTAAGQDLGRLVAVHGGPEVDVWEIQGQEGVIFLPALREHLVEVRPPEGIVVSERALAYRLGR